MTRFIDFQFSNQKIQRRERRRKSSIIIGKRPKHIISKITPHITSHVNGHKQHAYYACLFSCQCQFNMYEYLCL